MRNLNQQSQYKCMSHFLCRVCFFVCLACTMLVASCQLFDTGPDAKERDFLQTRIQILESKIDSGETAAVQVELEPLLRRYPENPQLLTLSGFANISLQNHVRAVQDMKKVFSMQPSPSAALNLSAAYIASKQYGRALAIVNRGIELHKEQPYGNMGRLYHNRGYIYELTKRYDLAVKNYQQALYHSPSFVLTLERIAVTYERINHKQAAMDTYKRWMYVCAECFVPMEKLVLYYSASSNPRDKEVAQNMVKNYLKNRRIAEIDKSKAEKLLRYVSSPRLRGQTHISSNPKL